MYKAILVTVVIFIIAGCQVHSSANSDLSEHGYHYGKIEQKVLLDRYPAFAFEYQQYQPSPQDLDRIQHIEGKELVVLFGTWCHDSEREVPRLLKLLDLAGVGLKKLELVAVNYDKTDPQGLATVHQLRYTPTMVLLEEGKEIGRVIEKPTISLATDLMQFTQ